MLGHLPKEGNAPSPLLRDILEETVGTLNRIILSGIAILPLIFCAVGISMLPSGCSAWENRTGKTSPGAILFNTIEKGLHSDYSQSQPVSEPSLIIIETKDEFSLFWSRHHGTLVPPPPMPDVDFALYSIIVLLDRVEPSGGYSIEISRLEPGKEKVWVSAVKKSPGRGCVTSQALTQPYHIIMVEKESRGFSLKLQEVTSSCGSDG